MELHNITFRVDDHDVRATQFLALVQHIWPGTYDPAQTEAALRRTTNITAWHEGTLIGCVRLLTDGYLFGTIPDIFVDPAYQGHGIGRRLMELAWQHAPTSLFLGAQPGKEGFFETMGFEPSLKAYHKRKPRPT